MPSFPQSPFQPAQTASDLNGGHSNWLSQNGFAMGPDGKWRNSTTGVSASMTTAPEMPDLPGITPEYDRLKGLFNKTGGAYNTSAFAATQNENIGTLKALTENSANNLGRNFLTQSNLSGGQGTGVIGAQVLRANALLGGTAQINKETLDGQKYIASQKQEAIKAQAGIAQQLASLQTNYIGTLAGYNAAKAGNTLDYAKLNQNQGQFDQSYVLQQAQLKLQQDASARAQEKADTENVWGWDDGLGQKAGVYADHSSPYYRG